MNHVRIRLDPTIDNCDDPSFWFDLVLNHQNRVAGKHMAFGLNAEMKRRDVHFYPVVLFRSGQLDFGTTYGVDQFGETDLLDGEIIKGRLIEIRVRIQGVLKLLRYRIEGIEALPA